LSFKTARRNNVTLDVSEAAQIDIALEVGAVAESVDATAQEVSLDSTTSSVRQHRGLEQHGKPASESAQSVFPGVPGAWWDPRRRRREVPANGADGGE